MSILFLIKPEKQRIKMLWERVSHGMVHPGKEMI